MEDQLDHHPQQQQEDQDEAISKIIVIDEKYCTTESQTKSQNFVVKKKYSNFQTSANFEVFDAQENILLHAVGLNLSIHRTFLVKDLEGSPLVTLREARILDKHRWELYEGDSKDVTDYICKVQRTSSAMHAKSRLEVFFLNHDPNSDEGKFQIKEEHSTHSSIMYHGNRVIAHVHHKHTWKNFLKGTDVLKVEVCEGVDYAFVMTILIIMVLMADR